MSDWRGGNEKGGRKSPEDRTPRKLPVIPPLEKSPSESKDWRAKSKRSVAGSSAGERSWTGGTASPAPKTFILKKSAIVGFLGLIIFGSIITFVVVILRRNPKLPLIVSASRVYSVRDLGENAYSSQTLQLGKTIPLNNISPSIPNPTFQEQFLKEVGRNENWIKSYSEMKSTGLASSGSFQGGGPGKNITAYFVSCYIARATDSEASEWLLVAENEDPYGSKSDQRGLPIGKFLERVAKQTKPRCFAWVALDVKQPSVVANLGDLAFPFHAFEQAFRGLESALQDKLILTLPCDEAQESWMAPEFSNSVFAHYFFQGIVSGFGSSEKVFTLEAFEHQLSDNVRRWVAMHRVAHQTPKFLMSENTVKRKSSIRLFETTGVKKDDFVATGTSKQQLADKFQQIDKLWEDFAKLRSCSRWDPLAYAEIESQLILMEDLAENNASPTVWSEYLDQAGQNLDKLKASAMFARRASLVEAKSHSLVRPCNFFSSGVLAESNASETPWLSNPPFWQSGAQGTGSDPNPELAKLPRNDRCLQVWSVMEKYAKANEASGWARAFTKVKMASALAYIGSPEGNDDTEWLEIQILKILLDEIDWENATEKSFSEASEAVAKSIAAFSELQGIASSPNAELSWWTEQRLMGLDREFLQAFDHLIANQFDLCIKKLATLESPLLGLRTMKDQLDAGMESRDLAFGMAPHALAALMRLHRYVAGTSTKDPTRSESQFETLAKELGDAIRIAVETKNFLLNPDTAVIPLSIGPNVKLDAVISELNTEFASQKVLAKRDAETIRNCRIALRWPMLPVETRKEFHSQLASYYEKVKEEPRTNSNPTGDNREDAITEISHRTPRRIADVFKSRLKDIRESDWFATIAERDLRVGLETRFPGSPPSLAKELWRAIYNTNYSARIQAGAYGQRASADCVNENEWPWNAVVQFQRLSQANYNRVQIQRLFLSRWGDGDLNAPRNNKYFFQRIANQYQRPRDILSPFPLASKAIDTDPESLNRLEEQACHEIKDIELRLSATAVESGAIPERWSKVRVDLKTQPWQAMAAIKLGRPLRKPFSASSKKLAQSLSLDQPSSSSELQLPTESVGEDKLSLSLRGHFHDYPIPSPTPKNSYQITFERVARKDSTLQVTAKNSEPITVWILLDCSASMKESHADAKKTVSSLLREIQNLNMTGENPVQVGLIPFGLKLRKSKGEDPNMSIQLASSIGLKDHPIGDQIFYSDIERGSDMSKIESIVRSGIVGPSGCTPLYDAIYVACQLQLDGRTRIVVVSDGSNDVPVPEPNDPADYIYYKGKNKDYLNVIEEIKQSKASLFVFQFKNDNYFRGLELDARDQAKKSNDELATLLRRLSEIGKTKRDTKFLYNDFSEATQDLLASFPRSKVRVLADDTQSRLIAEGRFGEEIKIPYDGVPYWAVAEVESMGDSVLQKQRAKVWITGNQKLELRYRSDINELNFMEFDLETNASYFNMGFDTSDTGLSLFARPIPEPSGGSKRELIMETAIRGKSPESERRIFTVPPKFAVGLLKPFSGDVSRTYLLCDVDYLSRTHYPVLRFPLVPWGQNKQWFSKQMDFEVWLSDEVPDKAMRVPLGPKASTVVQDGRVHCIRSDNRVSVTVKSNDDDRLFVYCPEAQSARRTFPETTTNPETESERHEFELSGSHENPINVFLFRLRDLKEGASQGQLKYFYFRNKGFVK